MSTQAERLLPLTGRTRANLYDWSRQNGIEFTVAVAERTGHAEVVFDPDPTDSVLGDAHASVRLKEPDHQDWKARWNDVRAIIAEHASLMPEDPNPP